MIKAIEFGEKVFKDVNELHKALKSNKEHLINLKKTVKRSKALNFIDASKLVGSTNKDIDLEEGFIYPVINTTNYLDSHGDVHIKGIWNKSAREQQNKIYYIINHKLEIGNVISYPKDVEIMLVDTTFENLGKDVEGETQALVFKTKLQDYSNAEAKHIIENRLPAENSVSMIYVKIDLAINNTEKGFESEKAIFDKYIDTIANKEKAIEETYFWAVTEAKIHKEGSMVLQGSNDATPILYPEINEPSNDTQEEPKSEPSDDTQELITIINELKF